MQLAEPPPAREKAHPQGYPPHADYDTSYELPALSPSQKSFCGRSAGLYRAIGRASRSLFESGYYRVPHGRGALLRGRASRHPGRGNRRGILCSASGRNLHLPVFRVAGKRRLLGRAKRQPHDCALQAPSGIISLGAKNTKLAVRHRASTRLLRLDPPVVRHGRSALEASATREAACNHDAVYVPIHLSRGSGAT